MATSPFLITNPHSGSSNPIQSPEIIELVDEWNLPIETFLSGSRSVRIWQNALSRSAWELSESISPWFDYHETGNRLTGSSSTRRDFEFQEAEKILTMAHLLNRRQHRFQEKGGSVSFTGYKDNLNQLKKVNIGEMRNEANDIIRGHIFSAVSSSLTGSVSNYPNFNSAGDYVIGSGRYNQVDRLNDFDCDSVLYRKYGRFPE